MFGVVQRIWLGISAEVSGFSQLGSLEKSLTSKDIRRDVRREAPRFQGKAGECFLGPT